MPSLRDLLTDKEILDLAGEWCYEAGRKHLARGAVSNIESFENGFDADVSDDGEEEPHFVEISISSDGELEYECSCKAGSLGEFCDHCVAAALGWRQQQRGPQRIQDAPKQASAPSVDRQFKSVSATIDDALWKYPKDFHITGRGWNMALQQQERINLGFNALTSLMHTYRRNNTDITPVIAYLTDLLDRTAESEALDQFMPQIAKTAILGCKLAGFKPAELAGHVFEIAMCYPEISEEVISELNKELGPVGMQEIRRLAVSEWEQLEDRPHSERQAEHEDSLAEVIGFVVDDVDELVNILSRRLNQPDRYVEIIRAYMENSRLEDAIPWIGEAIATHPANRELQQLAANLYSEMGQFELALPLIWKQYLDQPGMNRFVALEKAARGLNAWAEWRFRAMHELRRRIDQAASQRLPLDNTLLVHILLHEQDPLAAWNEARQGECGLQCWRQIVEDLTKTHPHEATLASLDLIERQISSTSDAKYEELVRQLAQIAKRMQSTGHAELFTERIEAMRKTHALRRKFIALTDRHRSALLF